MRIRMIFLVIALFAIMPLGSSAYSQTSQRKPVTSIQNTSWQWVSFYKSGTGSIRPKLAASFGLFFNMNDTIFCTSDCNNYRAQYQLNGDKISFGSFTGADTDGCEESQEYEYMNGIMNTESYRIDDDYLIFTLKDGGGSMIFRPRTTNP